MSQIEIKDNSKLVLQEMKAAAERALEICGGMAEGYAKDKCPVDSGMLRNSISHKVKMSENACYIGSNIVYAPYVEFGTGKYYPGGRNTPWYFQDEKGDWHKTSGSKPQPYLRPAVADHAGEYQNVIKSELRG